MNPHAVVVVLAALVALAYAGPIEDSAYLQPTSLRTAFTHAANPAAWPTVDLPVGTTPTAVLALTSTSTKALLPTPSAVYVLDTETLAVAVVELPSELAPPTKGSAMAAADGWIALVNPGSASWLCPEASVMDAPASSAGCGHFTGPSAGNITAAVLAGSDAGLWFGTVDALYSVPCASGTHTPVAVPQAALPANAPTLHKIRALAYDDARGVLAVASHKAVFRLVGGQTWLWTWRRAYMGMKGNTLTFAPDGTLWIGSDDALVAITPAGSIVRYNGVDRDPALSGLPYANMTSSAVWTGSGPFASAVKLWIGTADGVVVRDLIEGSWAYYQGPRWVSGNAVIDVAALGPDRPVVVLTEDGVSLMGYAAITLADKAAHYMDVLLERHNRVPPGATGGLVGDVTLAKFGQTDTWLKQTNANNGLWTGMVVGGLALQYAATGDAAARDAAYHYFEGLELLREVTGIPGYPARCAWPANASAPGSNWYNSTTYPLLQWNGDTSSDEITGHIFGSMLTYALGVARSGPEADRIVAHVTSIVDGIMEHGYELYGEHGNRTTWGVWSPAFLNGEYTWRDQRGLNALQLVSFLASAYEMTENPKYLDAMKALFVDHGYGANIRNTKVTWYKDDNFSDDELNFVPLLTLLFTHASKPIYEADLRQGMEALFARVVTEKSSLWNAVYLAWQDRDPSPFDFDDLAADAVATLRQWPVELINWPTDTAARLDTIPLPFATRGKQVQALNLIPYDEQCFARWNSNPFILGKCGNGLSETDPGAWILPYGLALYIKLLV